MITTFRPDEDEYVEPAPAAEQPPEIRMVDERSLEEREGIVPMGTCAFCGACRPMSELEYCKVWLSGVLRNNFYCHERRNPQSWLPICARNAEMSSEG